MSTLQQVAVALPLLIYMSAVIHFIRSNAYRRSLWQAMVWFAYHNFISEHSWQSCPFSISELVSAYEFGSAFNPLKWGQVKVVNLEAIPFVLEWYGVAWRKRMKTGQWPNRNRYSGKSGYHALPHGAYGFGFRIKLFQKKRSK
jgi:hypothetical protein